MRSTAFTLLAAAALAASAGAFGQDYPGKPIRWIVPYAPGGGTDTASRVIAPKLSDALRQPVIVETRPGASTNIATEFVAKSAPDGYTVLIQAPNLATNAAMFVRPGWSIADLTGVILLVRYANVLVAAENAKITSFQQLIASAKANAKPLSYGTPGVGSLSHLATELVKARTGAALEHVSYKGSGALKTDLIGGHVPLATDNLNSQLENIRSGKVRPLAVLSSRRDPSAPDVPSLADLGMPGIEGGGWYGVVVPAKTPGAIVARLNAEITRILALPEVRERLVGMGLEIVGSTPEEFTRFVAAEQVKWAEAVRLAGIKPE